MKVKLDSAGAVDQAFVAMSTRACFRMSLTDLADSISFALVRPAYSRTINFRTREPLAPIKFYENEKEGDARIERKTECIRTKAQAASFFCLRRCIADSRDIQVYGGAACASDRMSAHIYARDSGAMRSSGSLIFVAEHS